jgi:type VI secretion system secreted protein VgrG
MPATDTMMSLTSPAGADALTVTRLSAVETISELFHFEVTAVGADGITPVSMLNQPACVALNNAGTTTRYFHGIVLDFGAVGKSGPTDTQYRFTLVPRLAETSLQADCRMFFKKTAKDILQTIFTEAGVTAVTFRLYGTPVSRDATAQYNETSLHFVTRLMEEEGWFYFFEHAADSHTLIVTDSNSGFQAISGADLRFGPGDTADQLTQWETPQTLTHGKVSLRDYDPDAPSKQLKANKPTVLKHGGASNREVFHWPGLTRDTGQIADLAKRRMEAAEAGVSLVQAAGRMGSLYAGGRFTVKEGTAAPAPYVVREIRHLATDDLRRAGSGSETYSNSFTAFANTVPWRQPMATARPRMEGLHTAIVLAPSGEEIYTDDQGRIKVRFFWDWREDATADNSAWVRVVQPWAGNGWGGQFIPRINTEVAVAFMDADPDRPVVVGGFYNATDKPIFPVAEKTKTGFRSRSVLKGGTDMFNEFSFDDTKDSEVAFLHAQKDLTTEVENDQVLKVDHDRTVTVKGKETVTIKGNRAHEVTEGDESLLIKQGNQSIEVDTGNQATTLKTGNQTLELSMGNQTTTLDMGNQSTEAKLGNITVKADVGAITLQALQSITLKVGSNSLTISPTGVEIKGMMVSIEGQISTEVKGLMTTTSGSAMLTLKGAITMIN